MARHGDSVTTRPYDESDIVVGSFNIQPAIDHVLYSKEFEYRSTRVIRNRVEDKWPSDHYPLFVTLSIPRWPGVR